MDGQKEAARHGPRGRRWVRVESSVVTPFEAGVMGSSA